MKMFKTFKYIVYCMSGTVLSSENHKTKQLPTLPQRTYSVVENSIEYTRDKDTRHAAIRAVPEEKYSDVGELYCIRTFHSV